MGPLISQVRDIADDDGKDVGLGVNFLLFFCRNECMDCYNGCGDCLYDKMMDNG